MDVFFGEISHGQRPHAETVLKLREMVKEPHQKSNVGIYIDTEIVRMPPEMEERICFGRASHRRANSHELRLVKIIPVGRAQEMARCNIHHIFYQLRLINVSASNRHVGIY